MKQKLWFLFFAGVLQATAYTQPVKPDPNFGTNGNILFSIDQFATEFASSIAVQQNNKLLIAATGIDDEGYNGRATVRRFFTDGTIDSSFAHGLLRTGRGRGFYIADLSLQADDKLVTFTRTYYHADDPLDTLWVERYLPDGGVDSSFGTNGAVYFTQRFTYSYANQLLLKPNGNIVVRFASNSVNYIAQLLPSGKADINFGTGGTVIPSGYAGNIRDLIALPNNQLLASSIYQKADNTYGSCLVRYTPQGKIDSAFGTNGILFNNNTILVTNRTIDLTLQPNNKVLVYTEDNGYDVLLRYNPTGTLDLSFGVNGKVTVEAINHSAYSIATQVGVQANGRILVSLANTNKLARFYQAGTLDSSFGTNGILTVATITGVINPLIVFLAYQTKLIVAGTALGMYSELVSVNVYVPCSTCSSADAANDSWFANSPAQSGLSFYPNPVKNQLTIRGLNSHVTSNIMITNAAGEIVTRGSVKNETYQCNVSQLLPGMYYISIATAGKTERLRFVKE